MQDNLEQIMSRRKTPEAPPADLAERIIAASQPVSQDRVVFVWFKPALAFAAMLAIVVAVSFYMAETTPVVSSDTFDEMSRYMVYETLLEFEDYS